MFLGKNIPQKLPQYTADKRQQIVVQDNAEYQQHRIPDRRKPDRRIPDRRIPPETRPPENPPETHGTGTLGFKRWNVENVTLFAYGS